MVMIELEFNRKKKGVMHSTMSVIEVIEIVDIVSR